MIGLARRTFLLLLLTSLPAFGALAQTGRVSGIIQDNRGEPVSGANVVVTGTLFGTVTGADGTFNFENVRYGSYELKVIHASFTEARKAIDVNAPTTSVIVRMRKGDIDLSLSTLDGITRNDAAWAYDSGVGLTPAGVASDRITLLPMHQARPFFPGGAASPGMINIPGPLPVRGGTSGHLQALPAFSTMPNPVRISTLATHSHSGAPVAATVAADLFDQSFTVDPRSVSAAYNSNAGGPSVYATFGGSDGRARYSVRGAVAEIVSDYSTGGTSSVEGSGRRIAAAGWASYQIGATSMVVLTSSLSALSDVPEPRLAATLGSSLTTDVSLQYRKALSGLLSYVDIKSTARAGSLDRVYADSAFVLPLSDEEASETSIGLDITAGGGSNSAFRLGISGSYENLSASRTAADDSTQLEIALLPSLDVLKSAFKFAYSTRISETVMSARAFAGIVNVSRDPDVNLGLVNATSKQYGTIAGTLAATTPLNPTWDLQVAASHGVYAPDAALVFANGILVRDGQSVGTGFSELPESMKQTLVRINLGGNTRLANLLLSGLVNKQSDALTLTTVEERSTRSFRIDNTDRFTGALFVRSLSSALEIVFLELSGRLVFGSNSEFDEMPASLPQHALGGSLYLRSPNGGSYLRGALTKYFSRTDVSDRLGEWETPGASVVDIGAGYQKNNVQFELGVENLFDNTYRHHLGSFATGESFRLAEQGRNASVVLTYTF